MRSYRRKDNIIHNYTIRYTTQTPGHIFRTDIEGSTLTLDDIVPFKLNAHPQGDIPMVIVSAYINGNPVSKSKIEQLNAKLNGQTIDECDGGDAGTGASCDASAVASDGVDTAAEMVGTTTTDVLGTYEPGKGFMGKDNFYIPAKAKVPLHRWEIANGGSKRKKGKNGKPKKYEYEKGTKVVVDMFENDMMLEADDGYTSYEDLHGKDWEDVKAMAKKKAIEKAEKFHRIFDRFAFEDYLKTLRDRWEAAQLPPPDIAQHGPIGACTIDDDKYQKSTYLKQYFIHGWYKDRTMFEIGPMRRSVASQYMSLHKLSLNSTVFKDMKAHGFSGITEIGVNDPKDKIPLEIVKLKDGYWLYSDEIKFKAGPFANKMRARMYAMSQRYTLAARQRKEDVNQETRIEYPTFAFSYNMMGVPCMDIVVAEDINRAMKLFDYQWHVFDNTRPIKQVFNNLDELRRSLALLRIKDIEIDVLDNDNVDDYMQMAKDLGNPSTIPQLKSKCRNPKFRYILGRDEHTGRSPVKIDWTPQRKK